MANEIKAQQIAEEYRDVLAKNTDFDVNDLDLAEEDVTRLTLEMAEWKDSLIIDELNKQIDRANRYYDNKLSHNEILKSIGAITSLVNLLNIEFPYDRLHMGFATLD